MWINTEVGELVNLDHVDSIGISEPRPGHFVLRAYLAESPSGDILLCSGKEKTEQHKDGIAERLNAYTINKD